MYQNIMVGRLTDISHINVHGRNSLQGTKYLQVLCEHIAAYNYTIIVEYKFDGLQNKIVIHV